MSSAFVSTPLGSLPKQENFKVAGIFNTGFIEFDQNVIFMPFRSASSLFEISETDIDLEIFLKISIAAFFP